MSKIRNAAAAEPIVQPIIKELQEINMAVKAIAKWLANISCK
jgi:hypothetical protein